ncbi:MAG: hypothetical protein U1D30_21910 [Planctomycetota bacterium]
MPPGCFGYEPWTGYVNYWSLANEIRRPCSRLEELLELLERYEEAVAGGRPVAEILQAVRRLGDDAYAWFEETTYTLHRLHAAKQSSLPVGDATTRTDEEPEDAGEITFPKQVGKFEVQRVLGEEVLAPCTWPGTRCCVADGIEDSHSRSLLSNDAKKRWVRERGRRRH